MVSHASLHHRHRCGLCLLLLGRRLKKLVVAAYEFLPVIILGDIAAPKIVFLVLMESRQDVALDTTLAYFLDGYDTNVDDDDEGVSDS